MRYCRLVNCFQAGYRTDWQLRTLCGLLGEDSRSICWYEHPSNFGGLSTKRLALTMRRGPVTARKLPPSPGAIYSSGSHRLCDLSSALVCSVLSRSLA